MKSIKNTCILASAGTGKTFQLSDRIISLLITGQVNPNEIAALTFTRAAAAEFIIKVIGKLKEAASDKKSHEDLCKRLHIEPKDYPQKHFLELLKKTLHASNQITMGTLDSFFAKLVNNFPLEVGLNTGSATTISEIEADERRTEALQFVLGDPKKAENAFNNLREYRNDTDVANPMESLVKMVKEYHGLYMTAKDENIWGNAERIFGKQKAQWLNTTVDPTQAIETITAYLATLDKEPQKFKDLISVSKSTSITNGDLNEIIPFFEVIFNGTDGESSSYVFGRDIVTKGISKNKILDAKTADAVRLLIRRAINILINARIKQTGALYRSLKDYETEYDQKIRRQGSLGFSDYVTLITQADPFKREEMEFRLDCSIKHWLLDEFQDTSTLQYEVLKRNIDEIIQSPEDRSVFIVGDLKQSLYQWRSGNRKLLSDLYALIDKNREIGESYPLNGTRRCSPIVLEMVNEVLGGHETKNLGRFYSINAAKNWSQNFQEQKAENKKLGESLWIKIDKPKDPEFEEVEAQARWIANHLKSKPGILTEKINGNQRLKPGLTCAILVSKNTVAAEITEVLRKQGIEATDEAKATVIKDNPVTFGLICLIQATIHPDNNFAKGTAEISPASAQIIKKLGGFEKASASIAYTFSNLGAEGLINFLLSQLSIDLKYKFIFKRLNQLRSLAVQYDVRDSSDRDLTSFVDFIENVEMRDTADSQTVQVITIHRSKGLEYDMVYMPCLNDSWHKIAELRRNDLLQKSDAEFKPQWLLTSPGENICNLIPELRGPMEEAKAENAYGNLCRLYVGMTRAKHCLVMISHTLSETKEKFFAKPDPKILPQLEGEHDFACLLQSTLTNKTPKDLVSDNKDDWKAKIMWNSDNNSEEWIQVRLKEEKEKSDLRSVNKKLTSPKKFKPVTKIEKKKPSEIKSDQSTEHDKSWEPSGDKVGGKLLGSAVHSLFEKHTTNTKEFLEEINIPSNTKNSRVQTIALELVNACLTSQEIVKLLDNRSADTIVWREQKAVLQHEGKMIDAVFDRVHIIPGKEATIIDYKTNRDYSDDELESKYKGQMNIYRESISKLTGIPEDKITCVLINVRNKTLRKF
jgi:ATP-dependent exoDNAse (exonuclease V) beta subunit